MRGKWEILSVSLPKKLRLYRNLQRFYGSDTNGLVETRGVEPLTSTLPALRSTS